MSKKRKVQETNLPVQSRRTENAITASVTIPTAPLSAFAAARAKAKIASSDSAHSLTQDGAIESISASGETSKSKKLKIAKSSQPRTATRRKEKENHQEQDYAIDPEDVFSQLPSSSKHSMPEPYKLPDRGHNYESDDRSDQELTEAAFPEEPNDGRIVQMSTWSPTNQNCIFSNSKSEQISMNNGETLSILGQYRIKVHEGVIIVAGAFLAAGAPALEIYAPSTSSIPVIKCIKFEGAVIEISQITADEHTTEVLERVSPLYSPESSAIWGRATDSQPSFLKILDSQPISKGGSFLPMEIPKAWQERINGFCSSKTTSSPIIQLCGPANVGKSTFATILTNSLLTSPGAFKRPRTVVYLDLDQNKQEYGPPGQISLVLVKQPNLKPRFTRSAFNDGENKVVKAHAIRLNGHKEDMEHYLEAVRDLLQQYQSLLTNLSQDTPLIVNCPFWFQASGYDLTVNLTETLNPSHVLCLASGPAKVLQWVQKAAGTTSVEILPPQSFLNTNKSPRTTAEVHEMHMLSYFHAEIGEEKAARWNALPLAHQRPFDVSYGEKNSEFAGVFIFGEVPTMYSHMLSTLLNGSIVSLLAIEDASALENRAVGRGDDDGIPYFTVGSRGYTIPFDPRRSRVIGLGLIRGIDTKAQTMQIVTPVPAKQIAEVPWNRLILAFGSFESPGWAYLEETYHQEWAKGQGGMETRSDLTGPWVEETGRGDDGNRSGGLGMQVWKARRFQ